MENGINKLPSLTISESLKTVFNNLTNFSGRSRRSELWWAFLTVAIIDFVLSLVLKSIPLAGGIITTIVQFALLSAVTVRRLHDRGQCGWWVAASLLVSIANIVYYQTSGLAEAASAVNPDVNEVIGHLSSPATVIIGTLSLIVNVVILIFCLLDSKPEANKYGLSPKYKLGE